MFHAGYQICHRHFQETSVNPPDRAAKSLHSGRHHLLESLRVASWLLGNKEEGGMFDTSHYGAVYSVVRLSLFKRANESQLYCHQKPEEQTERGEKKEQDPEPHTETQWQQLVMHI